MKPWTLTRTFLLLCCALAVGAIVLGSIASPTLERDGWIALVLAALAFLGLTVYARSLD